MNQRKYGWKQQQKDERDFKIQHLSLVRKLPRSLPVSVNLQEWCSPVQDQGDLGACTAHAWAGLLQYNENKWPVEGRKYFDMSRLFIYYNERLIEGTVSDDSGAQLRDGAKAIATYGSCPETDLPYVISEFATKPSDNCYNAAKSNIIHSYYSLDGANPAQTLFNLKTCLAAGQPFVFGFTVYDSFESDEVAKTGIMPMPNVNTEAIIGGHAVMGVGYDDAKQAVLVRNSWGPEWGQGGYFWMPYEFISNPTMASDFWTLVKEI